MLLLVNQGTKIDLTIQSLSVCVFKLLKLSSGDVSFVLLICPNSLSTNSFMVILLYSLSNEIILFLLFIYLPYIKLLY